MAFFQKRVVIQRTISFAIRERYPEEGRIAYLDDKLVFPVHRFRPTPSKNYDCKITWYGNVGIARPVNEKQLTEKEWLPIDQIIVDVVFWQGRKGEMISRHPSTGMIIFPDQAAKKFIEEKKNYRMVLIPKGTVLIGMLMDQIISEKGALTESGLAEYEDKFARTQEMKLSPMFEFKGKDQFPWEILGIEKEADLAIIENTFRELAKTHHPDAGNGAKKEDYISLSESRNWMVERKRRWQETRASIEQKKPDSVKQFLQKPKPQPTTRTTPTTKVEPDKPSSLLDELVEMIKDNHHQAVNDRLKNMPFADFENLRNELNTHFPNSQVKGTTRGRDRKTIGQEIFQRMKNLAKSQNGQKFDKPSKQIILPGQFGTLNGDEIVKLAEQYDIKIEGKDRATLEKEIQAAQLGKYSQGSADNKPKAVAPAKASSYPDGYVEEDVAEEGGNNDAEKETAKI